MLTEERNKKKKGIDVSSETKTVSISAVETKMSDDPKAAPNLLDELEENLEASEENGQKLRPSNHTFNFHQKKNMNWLLQMKKKMQQ